MASKPQTLRLVTSSLSWILWKVQAVEDLTELKGNKPLLNWRKIVEPTGTQTYS